MLQDFRNYDFNKQIITFYCVMCVTTMLTVTVVICPNPKVDGVQMANEEFLKKFRNVDVINWTKWPIPISGLEMICLLPKNPENFTNQSLLVVTKLVNIVLEPQAQNRLMDIVKCTYEDNSTTFWTAWMDDQQRLLQNYFTQVYRTEAGNAMYENYAIGANPPDPRNAVLKANRFMLYHKYDPSNPEKKILWTEQGPIPVAFTNALCSAMIQTDSLIATYKATSTIGSLEDHMIEVLVCQYNRINPPHYYIPVLYEHLNALVWIELLLDQDYLMHSYRGKFRFKSI